MAATGFLQARYVTYHPTNSNKAVKYKTRAKVIWERQHGCELRVTSDPKSPLLMRAGAPKTVLLGTTRVSLANGISIRPTALAGCTSVTDDTHTHTPCYT